MNEAEIRSFLAEPHVAILAVSSGNQRPPLAVPLFYHYEPGGNFTFFTNTQGRVARKVGLIRSAGTVSMPVEDEQSPYRYVRAEAALVSIDQPAGFEGPYTVARRYMPEADVRGFVEGELAHPAGLFTLVTVKPVRWDSQDMSKVGD